MVKVKDKTCCRLCWRQIVFASVLICLIGGQALAQEPRAGVRARVKSALGQGHGCFYVMLDGEGHVLARGATDNYGELDCEISLESGKELCLLVLSLGMLRNSNDEWSTSAQKTEFPRRCAHNIDTREVVFGRDDRGWDFNVRTPADLVEEYGKNHNVTIVSNNGYGRLDSIARTRRRVPREEIIDFGVMRFVAARAALSVVLRLKAEDGEPFFGPVLLSGYLGDDYSPRGNRVYPHMALAQRGAEVRIILTKAALRGLLENPGTFLALAAIEKKTRPGGSLGRLMEIPMPRDIFRGVCAGQNTVEWEVVLGEHLYCKDKEDVWRGVRLPKFWDHGEEGFRW